MTETSELTRVPVFAGLPDDQVLWFIDQTTELRLQPNDIFMREDGPADAMFVVLEGMLQGKGDIGGDAVVVPMDAGTVTGMLPFSRMTKWTLTGTAITFSRLLRFPSAQFPELVQKLPLLAQRLVGVMSDRIREATRIEQQRDRLASLGKLSAGLAHELNNPASAAKRAASQLHKLLKGIRDASLELGRHELTAEQRAEIEKLESTLVRQSDKPPDALTAGDLEDEIDSLLRSHGHNDLWQLAACLGKRGAHPEALAPLFERLDTGTARAALVRIAASLEVTDLLHEIESSATRISDLVGAIKEYTFMDQAPLQCVDVIKGLENTLTILNHKLKHGVTVHRDYAPVPLLVDSFGSELNQVWTNIIDNAIDAMGGSGELRVRTYRAGSCAGVEIGDNGPGIPADVQPHIFEPFFTTKGVGEGTGLGLDTVRRIVRKHQGMIKVVSKPGDTRFQVELPLTESPEAKLARDALRPDGRHQNDVGH